MRRRDPPPPPPPALLFATLLFTNALAVCSMNIDVERLAARQRIDEKWDEIERFESGAGRSRKLRQIQPKEISIQVTAPLFSSRLFDYGPQAGDQELPQALDVGKKLELTNPISFYGSQFKTVYVLSNGGIGFEAGARSYKSNMLPGATRIIAPFWNRNDLRNGGKVYYREVTKGRVLERGQSEIRYQYDKNVKVISALIITWDKMQPLNTAALPEENTNTFQAALFITSNGTFANFIYSNIGWTQGAEAGFNAGDATNHFKLPTSGTPNIMYLEEYGNTGIPGEWMFELAELRVISCKAGIKGDTCDQECTSGEWGPDCAFCCHCSEGTCHAVTGDCSKGCATCWEGSNCQKRQDKCATKTQCAANALSFNDYDRCGEPIQRCQCLNGYRGDGYKRCDDVDECSANSTICHPDAICTNTPGRYFCQCKDGFTGDGQTECAQSLLLHFDTHKQLPKHKNAKMEWNLKRPIKVFGEVVDRLTITSTGLISIDEMSKDGPARLEEMQLVGIAPFFAPIDLSKGGSVSVEEVENRNLLQKVTRTIAENYNDPSFEAKSALVVTYSNVTDGKQRRGNTFQTLIIDGKGARGEKLTFAELIYRDLPWGSGAEAGILSRDAASSILLPASGTEAISQFTKLSNVKQPGTWLYRIDRAQLTPCAQAIQLPPYCDKLLTEQPRLPSVIPDEKKEDMKLPTPGSFQIDQPSETIRPSLVRGNQDLRTISVTSQSISKPKTTVRPRPNFSSTPHRPIVSLSDEDFALGPDAFEITFPPFVTVVPELFRPEDRKKSSGKPATTRPLPNFSMKTPLEEEEEEEIVPPTTKSTTSATTRIAQTTRRLIATTTKTPREEDFESPFESQSFDGETLKFTDEIESAMKHAFETTRRTSQKMETTTVQENEEEEEEGDVEDEQGEAEVIEADDAEPTTTTTMATTTTSTTTEAPITTTTPRRIMSTTTTPQSIFVFTTTKAPAPPPRRLTPNNIVTAPPKQAPPNANHTEEQSERKLAIILPVSIMLAWLFILLCIAGFMCCKKRASSRESSQLRAMYGAAYGVRPTSFESKRVKESSSTSSYEDHLERAARLGGQSAINAQQAAKLTLYGSYWNIPSGHSPTTRLSTQEHRSSPPSFINNGYTNPTRYTYAGHY
ncbi:unnamed protein product [Caenorhabditis bovis]|uniref:EGF-like domain-containing protein n=1 Tax=Caenorhabditis bovis TaxID=2654633 RepID=A0A8S1EWL9_9PELO|nr:unnamed protein product [Caenorhabditis bovis]